MSTKRRFSSNVKVVKPVAASMGFPSSQDMATNVATPMIGGVALIRVATATCSLRIFASLPSSFSDP